MPEDVLKLKTPNSQETAAHMAEKCLGFIKTYHREPRTPLDKATIIQDITTTLISGSPQQFPETDINDTLGTYLKIIDQKTNHLSLLSQGWKQLMSMEVDSNESDPLNQLSPPVSHRELTTLIFPSQSERIYQDQNYVMNCRRHSISLKSTPRTSNSWNLHSSPQPMHLSSPILNGPTLLLEPWLTSITSSQTVSQYPVTAETQKLLEWFNSNLVQHKPLSKSKLWKIGSSHGACTWKQPHSLSPTESLSSKHMDCKSFCSLLLLPLSSTSMSSHWTKPSKSESENVMTFCSQTTPSLKTLGCTGSTWLMQAVLKVIPKGRQNQNQISSAKMHVTDGIIVSAVWRPQNANIGISARSVKDPTKLTNIKKLAYAGVTRQSL